MFFLFNVWKLEKKKEENDGMKEREIGGEREI